MAPAIASLTSRRSARVSSRRNYHQSGGLDLSKIDTICGQGMSVRCQLVVLYGPQQVFRKTYGSCDKVRLLESSCLALA